MDDDKFLEDSKTRIVKIASKKILTVGISALSAFETNILNNPKYSAIAESLLLEYDIIRKTVLDAVNKQSRNLSVEAQDYRIEWLRHRITFEVKDKNGE